MLARVVAGLSVSAVIWGWGVAQYPTLLPRTTVTLHNAGAPHATLVSIIVLAVVAVLLVVPSFGLLFTLQGRMLLGGDGISPEPHGRHQRIAKIPTKHPET